MAAPSIRGQTAPVAGGSTTSPAGTQIGDLVIVFTWERAGAGVPTHTLQANFVEILSHSHDDGSTDGRLSIAYKIATAAGANSYQAYTTGTGSPAWWTGCTVLTTGTYDVGTLPPSAGVTQTNNAVPNPPSVALNAALDYLVFAVAAWHFGSSLTNTVTAPTNYTNLVDVAGAATGDVACSSRAITTGASSEDPGTYGDNQAPNGTCAITFGVAELVTDRRARVAWAELEVPTAPRRARVAWAELEVLDAPAPWPAAPVKDTFTYSNGSVEGQGAWVDWPLITNGLDVNSNAVRASTAVNLCGSLYQVSQGPDIEIYATITELPGEGFGLGMTWRQSTTTSTDTRYYFDLLRVAGSNNDTIGFGKAIANSYTENIGGIINLGFDIGVGDQLGVRMVGDTAEFWYKRSGGSWNRVGIRTDSSISTAGYGGLFIDRQPGKLDDFSYSTYPPRQARVAWAELEVPDVVSTDRRARVAWAELEVPTAPRRARVAWAELEVPTAPRRARVGWAELEVPTAPRRARVAMAELEVPDAPRRARVAFAELEVPTAPRRARVSWSEFEVPTAPRRARVSWVVFEVPEVGAPASSYFPVRRRKR